MAPQNMPQASASKVPLWRQPAFRAALFQILLVLGILAFGYYLLNNTLQNFQGFGDNFWANAIAGQDQQGRIAHDMFLAQYDKSGMA